MTVRLERRYKVMLGPEGEVLFDIAAPQTMPTTGPMAPLLIYAGGDHALLRRNAEDDLVLDYLHPDVRSRLKASKAVIVVERSVPGGGAATEYQAPVALVEALPAQILALVP